MARRQQHPKNTQTLQQVLGGDLTIETVTPFKQPRQLITHHEASGGQEVRAFTGLKGNGRFILGALLLSPRVRPSLATADFFLETHDSLFDPTVFTFGASCCTFWSHDLTLVHVNTFITQHSSPNIGNDTKFNCCSCQNR